MTLDSVVGIVAFFLFVVPGISYELLRRRTLLPVEESAFVQISRIALSGALLTALTVSLLIVVGAISPAALLDPAALIRGGSSYVAGNLGLIGKTLVLHVLVATLLAAIACDIRAAPRQVKIHRGTALFGLTEIDVKPGHKPWLAVHLKNGDEILGYYYGATTELDPDKRELVLQSPLKVGDPKVGGPPLMAPHWERVLILGREIEYMSVAYVDSNVVTSDKWYVKAAAWVRENALRAWVCLPAIILLLIGFAFPWP